MLVYLFRLDESVKPITRELILSALNSKTTLEKLESDSMYIDSMRNTTFVDDSSAVFRIKRVWLDDERDIIIGDIESLDTPISRRMLDTFDFVKFSMKYTYSKGVFNFIGFGYFYKPS
jgi:hypothetical protein